MTGCPERLTPTPEDYFGRVDRALKEKYRDKWPEPPDGTFEIGLCLAGAVSAGAYTAGVLDFLFEALDQWYKAKTDSAQPVPRHDVVISAIAGASAGGISAALAAIALPHDFPRAPTDKAASKPTGNLFYDAWVLGADFEQLFETKDLASDGTPVLSLLDCSVLSETVRRSLLFGSSENAYPPAPWRHYVAKTLRLILSVGNLRGVPYHMSLRGSDLLGHPMRMHADYMRFAYATPNGSPRNAGRDETLPDEIALAPLRVGAPADAPDSPETWRRLGDTALASGAFPFALQPRDLWQCAASYDYRRVVIPGGETQEVRAIRPAFPEGTTADYRFVCVDGGTFDNEPLEQLRVTVAGPLGRNPRGGSAAKRATILIDPFAEPPTAGPERAREPDDTAISPLKRLLLALVSAYTENARAKPVDLALAEEDTVYSRYIIVPRRQATSGAGAIAAGALGGFLGFLTPQYRHHDFHLGRWNCQRFLQQHLTLPADNPLFKAPGWTQDMKDEGLARPGSNGELPIIPLLGTAAHSVPLPLWPRNVGGARLDSLTPSIRRRADAIVDRLSGGMGRFRRIGFNLFIKSALLDTIHDWVVTALKRGIEAVDRAHPEEKRP